MTIVHAASRTQVDEIASGIFRISVPVPPAEMPGGFTFNQFLVVDDAPLLFHTGPKRLFPLVKTAVDHVLGSAAKLRFVGFSHVEADECGALNDWLAIAPEAEPVCSRIAAMVSVSDFALRPARALADLEELSLGTKRVRWLDTPLRSVLTTPPALRPALTPRPRSPIVTAGSIPKYFHAETSSTLLPATPLPLGLMSTGRYP